MKGLKGLMCCMLSCGTDDLEFLENVNYNWKEVLDQLCSFEDMPDFNRLMSCVIDVGVKHMKEAISDRIRELEALQEAGELDEDESKEKEALEHIEPEYDIMYDLNCLNTHVWFENNGNVYQQYLHEAIHDFENNVGICIDNRE